MASGENGSDGMAAAGRRAMGATGAITLVLLLLGICAAAASAVPLSMTFTEGRANVGIQLDDEALFATPKAAPFAAQIDPGSGSITDGVLGVPRFATHIATPIVADVTVDFTIGEIEGNFTQATGALTLEGTAGGMLTATGNSTFEGEECVVSTTPAILQLSTAESAADHGSPRAGVSFNGSLAGSGAIGGQWTDMQATPVDSGDSDNVSFCNNVETQIGGAGGVWLEQKDLTPPLAPQLTSTDPSSPGSSGTPRLRGSAEPGSTVRVYAGTGCAGAPIATAGAAEFASPGVVVSVAEGVTASFSATATDTVGNTSACSAPISYTHTSVPKPCVVPDVVGKKLKAAKRMIKAANCRVGEVRRPRQQKGKGRRPLVVKSSKPGAGAMPADGAVDLRLGPKPRKGHH